ncbi:Cysteine-rich secretory protein 2 [Mactra antiquata]
MNMEFNIIYICLVIISEITLSLSEDNGELKPHHIVKRKANSCLDRYAVIPEHTMCLSKRKGQPLSNATRDTIVKKHNEFRGQVSPTASNMLKMGYSEVLEKESQIWSEQCKMTHDHGFQRFQPGLFHVGQNIATSPGRDIGWEVVVKLWYDEYKKYTYGSKKYNLYDIGHYTQVVWATTALVGCGVNKCGNTYYYVYNYGPAGNSGSLDKPYKNGTACADCPRHCDSKGKLCDCGGKVCLNDGVLDLNTCQCKCNTNVKHYDVQQCDLYCDKDGDHPLCGNLPFDKGSCPTNSAATMNCPWLCGLCPYAGKNYTEGSVPLPSSSASTWGRCIISTIMLCLIFLARV